jgi:hypothetical protein
MLNRRRTFDWLLLVPKQAELRSARARHGSRPEHANHPVLAVIAGFRNHLTAAHPANALRQPLAARGGNLGQRRSAQDGQLRPDAREQLRILRRHLFGARAYAVHLGQDLRQGDEAVKRRDPARPLPHRPVGQRLHPVQHADGDLAAYRADAAVGQRDRRFPRDAALAVPVQVILALFGEELDRAAELAGPSPDSSAANRAP